MAGRTWSGHAYRAALQVPNTTYFFNQSWRGRNRHGGSRVQKEKTSHSMFLSNELHRIGQRAGGYVHASAQQRLNRLGAASHLGGLHGNARLSEIAKPFCDTKGKKRDGISVDGQPNRLNAGWRLRMV